jgi:hypothetical protein
MSRFSRTLPHPALAALALAYFGWSLAFIGAWGFQDADGRFRAVLFDDAMISMRYAWHLTQGHGLVWNVAEYVEGFTNPLWTLLMAGGIMLAGDRNAPLLVIAFGVLLRFAWLGLTGLAAAELARTARLGNRLVVVMVLLLSAAYYPSSYWSYVGMEVSAIGTLHAASAWIFLLARRKTRNPGLVLALHATIIIAYFIRPDAILFGLPLAAAVAVGSVADHGRRLPKLLLISWALPILLVGVHIAARLQYYGDVLPNTYRLKVEGLTVEERLSNGFGFMLLFVIETALLFVGAVLTLLKFPRIRSAALPLLASTLLVCAYQVWVGGDPWPYWRQMSSSLTGAFLIVGIGVAAWRRALAAQEDPRRRPTRYTAPAAYVAATVFLMNLHFWPEIVFRTSPYLSQAHHEIFRQAEAVRAVMKPDARILVFWAGVIPYHTKLRSDDALGKTEPHIAALPGRTSPSWGGMNGVPGHNKYDLSYSIAGKLPDYVQFVRWGEEDLTAFAAERYVLARHGDAELCLLRGSDKVLWEQVRIVGACGAHPFDWYQPPGG